MAPPDQNLTTQAKWKPNSVAIYLPPETPATKVCDPIAVIGIQEDTHLQMCTGHGSELKAPYIFVLVQVLLTGIPLAPGLFTITGCQVSAMGVSWMQPWLSRSAFLGQVSAQQAGATEQGGHAQVTILRSLAYASPCSGYGRPGLLDLISRVMWPAKASLRCLIS